MILREVERRDWIDVHKYAAQEQVYRYQTKRPNSEQESGDFFMQVILDAKERERTRYFFAIILKESGKMIRAVEFNIRDLHNS